VGANESLTAGVSLPVMRGDDFLASLNLGRRVALMKLQFEGMETRVISGLRNTLSNDGPLKLGVARKERGLLLFLFS
jgi:hypothetical protein